MAQDAGIAFSQNLVDRFIQFKMLRHQRAMEERREQRYEQQLKQNRLYQQQTHERLTGSFEHWKRQGFSDEESKQLERQSAGLSHKPMSPYQKMVAGKMIMATPMTSEQYESGKLLFEEGA